MWKRIQTLYIGIATVLTAVMFFCKMATIISPIGEESVIMYYDKTSYLIMLIMLLTAGVCSVFSFKNWALQSRVSMLSAIMMIAFQIWLGIDLFRLHRWSTEGGMTLIMSLTAIFPIVGAILNIMAARSALLDAMTVRAIKATNKVPKRKRR